MGFQFSLEGLTPLSPIPYVFSPEQEAWLAALENGKHKQAQGVLRSSTDEYCCLGVLAEMLGCERRLASTGTAYEYRGTANVPYDSTGYLPYAARRQAKLHSSLGAFTRPVKFLGLDYGKGPETAREKGHGSLAAMNDVRMIPDGNGLRAFSFPEIAAYIRFDPWNVFDQYAQDISVEPWLLLSEAA